MSFRVGDIVRNLSARTSVERDIGVVVSVNPTYVSWKRARATYMEEPSELELTTAKSIRQPRTGRGARRRRR